MKKSALLTARQRSKSIRNKNMYKVHGQCPLFTFGVMAAIGSKNLDEVYVTTDSKKIINICHKMDNDKVFTISRPPHLCQDDSSHYDTIMHGLEEIEKDIGQLDYLVVLLGNTIHANTGHLDSAIEAFEHLYDDYDSCMSVSRMNYFNPCRAFNISDDFIAHSVMDKGQIDLLTNGGNLSDKNTFGDTYFFNGSFWICKRETLFNNSGTSVYPWLGNKILPYIQPEGMMEVDAPWQLVLIEAQVGKFT